MTSIVLDEYQSAEKALNNLELGNKPTETLSVVARYYYGKGYKKSEITRLLEEFLIKCDPNVNIVKWQETIDRVVKSSDKFKLVRIDGVSITQSEMWAIQQLGSKLLQKLLFTMLCLAKFENAVSNTNNNWVNKKDRDIFGLANIKVTTKRQSLLINDLWNMGLIGYSRIIDNINVNVKIIDDESPAILFVDDFRNLGNQYMKYCGEKYIKCQCCGKVVKEGHGRQKYCPECAVEIDRQKAVKRYHSRVSVA